MAKKNGMEEKIPATLRAIPLFQPFSDRKEKLAPLAALVTTQHVKAGQDVIREGDIGDEMFILPQGEVEVTKTTLEKEQYTVAVLRDSDHSFFGEMALLDADKRSATIRAITPCEMVVLKRKDFDTLGKTHPDLGLAIMRELARMISARFRTTNEDVILLFEAQVNEVNTVELE